MPRIQDRHVAAQKYEYCESIFNEIPQSNVEACDNIRSLLVYSCTQFSLGNHYIGKELIGNPFLTISKINLHDAKTRLVEEKDQGPLRNSASQRFDARN
jgi:hypothetical protein